MSLTTEKYQSRFVFSVETKLLLVRLSFDNKIYCLTQDYKKQRLVFWLPHQFYLEFLVSGFSELLLIRVNREFRQCTTDSGVRGEGGLLLVRRYYVRK